MVFILSSVNPGGAPVKTFHEKFIAAIKSAQAYTKFWIAFFGGGLIIVTNVVPIDPQWAKWIGIGLAIATAFSVYQFPNVVPPVDESSAEVDYAAVKHDVLANFSQLTYEEQTADIQAARAAAGLPPV